MSKRVGTYRSSGGRLVNTVAAGVRRLDNTKRTEQRTAKAQDMELKKIKERGSQARRTTTHRTKSAINREQGIQSAKTQGRADRLSLSRTKKTNASTKSKKATTKPTTRKKTLSPGKVW